MAMDEKTQAVLREHPDYQKLKEEYQFFEESYKGGIDYINADNLFQHSFEDKEGFDKRKIRAYYYNYCAPIVNAYNSFIYRQEIMRDYGALEKDALFKQFLDNCDKRGTAYKDFFPALSKWASTSGLRFLLVDKPPEVGETQRDEIEQSLYPYFVHIDPQNVLDWGLDEFGNLKWIKLCECEADGDTFDEGKDEVDKYRIWYKDRWELWEIRKEEGGDKKAMLVEEGQHPVGEVPVIPVVHISEDPMRGFSLLNDIAYVNRALFNWCSLLDEILYRQTFSQLVMPIDENNPPSELTLGTEKGLTYNMNAPNPPEFISPDASQATVIMTQIQNGVEEIYRLATLRGAIGVEEQSSGVARSYDFMITNNTLSDKAHNMQSVEMRAMRMWAKWQGITDDPGVSIQYPVEFEISSLAEEIENIIRVQTVAVSNRFEQVLKERIVKRMAPGLSKEDMDTIMNEIKAKVENPQQVKRDEFAAQIGGILGTAGNGQGDTANQGGVQ